LARFLGGLHYITSCIDISDGLGRDLGHIAEKSSVKIVLKESWIDVSHLEGFWFKKSAGILPYLRRRVRFSFYS